MTLFSSSVNELIIASQRKAITDLYMSSLTRSAMSQEENAKIHLTLLELLHRKFSPFGKMAEECYIFSVSIIGVWTGAILVAYISSK